MKYLWLLIFFFSFSLQAADSIIDAKHHLEWQDDREHEENIWKMAVGYCKQLHIKNSSEWRLPTKEELVELSKSKILKNKFNFLQEGIYWSGEIDKNENLNAITVFIGNGFISSSDKCDKNFVMCVREIK